jgi:hypothetical protein
MIKNSKNIIASSLPTSEKGSEVMIHPLIIGG